MQVGSGGMDLVISRSGQRHIDALCLRKFNPGNVARPGPKRPFSFAAKSVSDGWVANVRVWCEIKIAPPASARERKKQDVEIPRDQSGISNLASSFLQRHGGLRREDNIRTLSFNLV